MLLNFGPWTWTDINERFWSIISVWLCQHSCKIISVCVYECRYAFLSPILLSLYIYICVCVSMICWETPSPKLVEHENHISSSFPAETTRWLSGRRRALVWLQLSSLKINELGQGLNDTSRCTTALGKIWKIVSFRRWNQNFGLLMGFSCVFMIIMDYHDAHGIWLDVHGCSFSKYLQQSNDICQSGFSAGLAVQLRFKNVKQLGKLLLPPSLGHEGSLTNPPIHSESVSVGKSSWLPLIPWMNR